MGGSKSRPTSRRRLGMAVLGAAALTTASPVQADPPTATTSTIEVTAERLDRMLEELGKAFAQQLGGGPAATGKLSSLLDELGFEARARRKLDGLIAAPPEPWEEVNLDGDAKKERLWVLRASEAPPPSKSESPPRPASGPTAMAPPPREARQLAALVWLDPTAKGYRVIGHRIVEAESEERAIEVRTQALRPSSGRDVIVEQAIAAPPGTTGIEIFSIARGKLERILSAPCQTANLELKSGSPSTLRCTPPGGSIARLWKWDAEAFSFR